VFVVPAPKLRDVALPASLPLFLVTSTLTSDAVGHELCQVTLADGLAAGKVAVAKHDIWLALQQQQQQQQQLVNMLQSHVLGRGPMELCKETALQLQKLTKKSQRV